MVWEWRENGRRAFSEENNKDLMLEMLYQEDVHVKDGWTMRRK